ncbi:unnamed protein product, partial [Symbiodinium sp. KB8]
AGGEIDSCIEAGEGGVPAASCASHNFVAATAALHRNAAAAETAGAVAYVKALPRRFPAAFRHSTAVYSRHAALVSALCEAQEAYERDIDGTTTDPVAEAEPGARAEVTAGSTASTSDTGIQATASAQEEEEGGDELSQLRSEVQRLQCLYEPSKAEALAGPPPPTRSQQLRVQPNAKLVDAAVVCSGEELRDLRQRTDAARLQVEAAEAAEAALLEKLKGELGEEMLGIMVSTIKESYINNPEATDKPAGTMQLELYNAMTAVPAAVAAHKELQEELQEAEK